MPEDPESPSWFSLAVGYRTQITAALGIVFEALQAFDVFPLTARQQSAITGLIMLLAGLFLALKIKRMHLSIAAVAQTGASTAEAVGAVVTPDPAPVGPPPAPVAPVVLLALLLPLAGCSQWGTSLLRSVDVWWACPDRHEQCSTGNAILTMAQMDNTRDGVRRDLAAARDGAKKERLRLAIARMEAARAKVPEPVYWGDPLADYVQAAVEAERVAERTYPKWRGL